MDSAMALLMVLQAVFLRTFRVTLSLHLERLQTEVTMFAFLVMRGQ
jgi:hypothetical protein